MAFVDRSLLQWLWEPSAERGLHFAGTGDRWDFWSYPALAELALRVPVALADRGVRRGDVVVSIQRSSPGFTATFFGSIAAGATACSIAPPFAVQRADEYDRHLAHLLGTARPALVVCDADSLPHARRVTDTMGVAAPVLFDDLVAGVPAATAPGTPAEIALLQFTSGSSGMARGVRVSYDALEANITAMRRWLDWGPDASGLTWLPVHHDMGLVGCLVNLTVTGCDGWMMQPEDFIRNPLRYLRCMADQRVALTAIPNFGLAYLLRRIRPAQLEGLRFDAMRSAILGAERIDPRVLDGIVDLLGPYGFDRRALLPAYGGAEATLAVTGLPPGAGWTTAVPAGGSGTPIVGCGRPLPGVSVRVVDTEDRPVPEGELGEIVVTGATVATGYLGPAGTASGTSLDGGVLHTGDAGFLRDGQLFVLGRLGDGLKVRGRMVFAESLEMALVERGVPERRAAVLLGVRDGTPTAAVVFDGGQPEWAPVASAVLREAIEEADFVCAWVPRGSLAVTSSGKPRRRVMWQALCAGTLPGEVVPLPDEPLVPA
jgi:acyl-CoA synthetase (AMP-forming)/AMP-acid ligase II